MKKIITVFLSYVLTITLLQAHNINATPPVQKMTIYWDSSLSMQGKDVAKELNFLTNYFKNVPNVKVELIVFSNSIDMQKYFTIENANWSKLKETLLKINYDGVAYFDVLLEHKKSDIVFLFTDGIETLDRLTLNTNTVTHIINSSEKANFRVLIKQSHLTKGKYINLRKIDVKKALSMLNIKDVKKVELTINSTHKEPENAFAKEVSTDEVSGIVYSSDGALVGATIVVNGNSAGAITNEKGEFKINAKEGDILTISYLGKNTKEIVVGESPLIEILLSNDENELEEVVVKGARKEETIDVGYGKTAKKKIGYAVQSIGGDDLPEGRDDNISIHGKFSGVRHYGQNDDISQMVFRANSILLNVFPLIIIDGTPVRRSSSVGRGTELTNFINPNNIDKITILKGLAATNRWGSEGSNGVILISTKSSLAGKKSKNSENTALVKNNDFTENLSLISTTVNEKYIEELKEFQMLNEVYAHYLKQRINYLNDPLYFVNISDFILQYGNKELSSKIFLNCLEINVDNIEVLRLIAYKYEQQQDFFLAKQIYEKIAKLKPRDAQAYRDLALIYQETGYYQKALAIYKKIQNDGYLGVDFSGIQKVVTNEMRGLLLKHKKELDISGVLDNYLKEMDYDARIVFEYNDNEAEFELQFVNPQKKFFSWSHTKLANEIRLYEEKTQGFNTEEFLLIDAAKGEWQINIESKVQQSKTPVILKYTVYKNYGKTNETKETKLVILNNIKEKQLLGKIII